MKPGPSHRFLLLIAAGGMVFQASASCVDQMGSTFATSVLPQLTSALTSAITDSVQCDTTTTTSGSITPPTDTPFTRVNDAIQGVNSQLGLTTPTVGGSSAQ